MDKMTFISQNHTTDNEITRSKTSKHGKKELPDLDDILELRFQLNRAKNETLTLVSKHNEELQTRESQIVKLRCEVEKGEVVRQSLEFDLAVARKQCGSERVALEDEKAKAIRIQEHFKEQMEELQRKMQNLQEHFQSTEFNWVDSRKALESNLQTCDRAIEKLKKEQEKLMLDKSKMEAVVQKQNGIIQELQQKLHQLDLEKNSLVDAIRKHKSELGFSLEREERLKKELETANQRVQRLEENIEAERAAHLESKFNSEIIQLRVRDLEGSLQVEKASQVQSTSELELIKSQFKELEAAFNREKSTAEDLKAKIHNMEKEHFVMVDDLKAEIEKKTKTISDISAKLSNSEENWAVMEQNFAMTKKQQLSLEEVYGYTIRELQGLVDSFNVSGLSVSGTHNNIKPAGPAVLEALRHTLTDYQNKLESSSNELESRRRVCEGLTQELQASKQIIQTLRKNLENAQSEQTIAEKELQHLSALRVEGESEISRLQKELGKAQDAWEKEARRILEAEHEIQKMTKAVQKDKEEKLTFLHSLYQRLVAGCVLIRQPESMLGNFSWAELCLVLQENVDVLISDLQKANEKVSQLEKLCKNKANLMKELQKNHENSLDKLAEQVKAQQNSWQKKSKDLEQHYSALLGESHTKVQKYQKIAEKLKDKFSISEKTKEQMALENVHIKNLLISTEKDHKSLLAACALMAGALCPLYSRSCSLAAQRNLLQGQLISCLDVQRKIRNLNQALSEKGVNKNTDTGRSGGNSLHLKLVFRKVVIVILAARRLLRLGRSSTSIFTWADRTQKIPRLLVCVPQVQTSEKTRTQDELEYYSEAGKWLTSTSLLSAIVSSMSDLLGFLNNKDLSSRSHGQINDTARNCFSQLMSKLNAEMKYKTGDFDAGSVYVDSDSLAHRLASGLYKIKFQASSVDLLGITSIKECLDALKKQIIAFTQRLHAAEVERRSLRRELSDMKQKRSEISKNSESTQKLKEQAQQSMVPYEKFKTAFEELNKALLREQEAQMLLHEQSQQLVGLNYKIESHSKEEVEKDQTLSDAIKSLSDAKKELWRKDQSSRQQSLQLTQLEQDKRRLEDSITSAEEVLRAAARDKDILISHMKSVSAAFQKIRDETSLSRMASIRDDSPIHLPKLTPKMFEMDGYTGGAEFVMCQIMIRNFLDVYQIASTKAAALERKITLNEKHIATLKSELQMACLREDKNLSPQGRYEVYTSQRSMTDFLPNRSALDFIPLQPEPDLSHSRANYSYTDFPSLTNRTSAHMQELPKT
ncbi:coiled-coil domain-containing protein 171 isoform X2 [Hyperolius riggenbachi]|uniref:coiled-coil domain-containing protein 171 isoform X2 n=1 Tax=Hyperolius riggenbachi TaxID=752182 RepID=UPI0035A3C8A7